MCRARVGAHAGALADSRTCGFAGTYMIIYYIIIYAGAVCAYMCPCVCVRTCIRTYMRTCVRVQVSYVCAGATAYVHACAPRECTRVRVPMCVCA